MIAILVAGCLCSLWDAAISRESFVARKHRCAITAALGRKSKIHVDFSTSEA